MAILPCPPLLRFNHRLDEVDSLHSCRIVSASGKRGSAEIVGITFGIRQNSTPHEAFDALGDT